MTISIFSEGKEYISASRAGEKTSYTSDYIGQLCRSGKVEGKLVGRTWYVDFSSLLEHRSNRQLGKPKTVSNDGEINVRSLLNKNTFQEFSLSQASDTKLFKYHKVNEPLMPELSSREGRGTTFSEKNLSKIASIAAFLMVVVSGGILAGKLVGPEIIASLENRTLNIAPASIMSSINNIEEVFYKEKVRLNGGFCVDEICIERKELNALILQAQNSESNFDEFYDN